MKHQIIMLACTAVMMWGGYGAGRQAFKSQLLVLYAAAFLLALAGAIWSWRADMEWPSYYDVRFGLALACWLFAASIASFLGLLEHGRAA